MPLTGQAKTDYQREYMRQRRSNVRSNKPDVDVRPIDTFVRPEVLDPVRPLMPELTMHATVEPGLSRPDGISDNQWAYIQYKARA